MKANLVDLDVKRTRSVKGVSHIRFQQKFKKIPVVTSDYFVHVKEDDNAIIMANGRYFPDITLSNTRNESTTPIVTSQSAIRFARSDVGLENVELDLLESRLVVFPVEDEYFLAWEITVSAKEIHSSWLIYIDASQGNILSKQSLIQNTNGTGRVYATDGGSGYSTVTLPRLNGSGYYLSGSYAQSFNDDGSEAYNASAQFIYSPSDDHFDEVNVYYHADKFEYDFMDLGYSGLSSVDMHVHYGTNYDNAGYSSSTKDIVFGDGYTKFEDLAKDRDVIYHEYMHAISDDIGLEYDETVDQGQSAAMNEAYSDYFCATFTGDATIGTWVTKSVDDLRDVGNNASTYKWSNYNNSVMDYNDLTKMSNKPHYVNGMIWSGALWDLRTALGATLADELIYMGLEYANGYATFLEGRAGIISYDQATYSGSHVSTIQSVFNNRGIIEPLVVTVSGDDPVYEYTTGYWSTSVSGGVSSYTYQWYFNDTDETEWEYGGTSSSYSRSVGPAGTFLVKCVVTDAVSNTDEDIFSVTVPEEEEIGKIGDAALPKEFALSQNYPNPFNPVTSIKYALPESQHVTLRVFNITGQLVAELVNESKSAGYHNVQWDASSVASGVYIYTISVGSFNETKKMVVMK